MNRPPIRESATPANQRSVTQSRYTLMLAYLNGKPAPALHGTTGRVFRAFDRPLTADELADITSPSELGLILGISRFLAKQRITTRAETAQSTEGTTP